MKPQKKIKEILCKTCFYRWRFEKEDWCMLIENEGGGSIEANLPECDCYLKKGTEPKWLCDVCGKNTYGESSTSEGGKHYCSDCYWDIEHKEHLKRLQERDNKIKKIVGDNKKANEIIKLL